MCLLDVGLTKDWLVERYLFGVSLIDPRTRAPFPEGHFNQAILQGRIQTEGEFDVEFCPETIQDEVQDLSQWSPVSHYLTTLNKKPLISVTKAELYYGKQLIRDVTQAIDVVEPKFSQLFLDSEALATNATTYDYTTRTMHERKATIRYTYRAGYQETELVGTLTANKDQTKLIGTGTAFKSQLKSGDFVGFPGEEARVVLRVQNDTLAFVDRPWATQHSGQEGTQMRIPSQLLEYTGVNAAMSLLITAGDLVIGAGVASMSRSIDGLSQSINTTASAENSAYSARIRMLRDTAKEIYERAMRDFRPIDMFVL